jgi:Flp pilus assembly protein TadD
MIARFQSADQRIASRGVRKRATLWEYLGLIALCGWLGQAATVATFFSGEPEPALSKSAPPPKGKGDMAARISAWRGLAQAHPTSFEAWHILGVALAANGQQSEATEALRKAVEIKPNDATALNDLGTNLFQTGAKAESLEYFRQATKANAKSADAWNNLALTLIEMKDWKAAEEAVRKATTLDTKSPRVWNTT